MPDEKRIKDFEPATELLIDDWFAVDSPSQGTRKMQASMFQEGLQTQITANTENIALHSGQISVLQQGVGNIGDKVDVLDAAITVEAYSASKLYAVGEDCVYEGVRYKCITAIETPEAFDPNKWQAISIEGELNELNSSNVIIGLTSTDIFTPASGVTMNTRPCYKRGKEIFFTAVFSMSNPVTTTNTLGTFKDGYKPNTQYYSIGMSYASGVDAGSASLINAGTNGITVEHTGAKAYLVVCAKYITN